MSTVSNLSARVRLAALLLVVLALSLLFSSAVSAQGVMPDDLQPGVHTTYRQDVPINVVFVGYEADDVDADTLLDQLPATYVPIVRYPEFYGLHGRDIGLHFNFNYRTKFANAAFEDDFFNYLASIGTAADPTDFQLQYNAQENNVLDVSGPVLYIDGPSAEQWLASNARRLGVDTRQGYTIFYINWYGRDDFQFHVYTKNDQPDPDTGYNFGDIRPSRKMIAWGGSHGRTWFYDLSAGPESWTDNWNVDNPDLDGDGTEEYRMPPVWEYTAGGYRSPGELSSDLGLVARFVAINLLFTSSPLYDPLVAAPGPQGGRVAHIELFEDDANSSGLDWIDADYIGNALESFQPYYDWQVVIEDNDPIDRDARRSLRIFAGLSTRSDCWEDFGTAFAQLFCYFDANYDQYIPEYGPQDYVAAVFAFNTTQRRLGDQFGLLGYADDNWIDGTQTYVFEFGAEGYRTLGYGFSTTTVHEVGHNIGRSHPHDGYDSELGIDYSPGGDFYFAWTGDESDSVMNYFGTSNFFGQFDEDNMYRIEMAGYLNWASDLLDDVLAHPDAGSVQSLINQANMQSRVAVRNFRNWDYLSAVTSARESYVLVATAAEQLGISTAAVEAAQGLAPNPNVPRMVDPIRNWDN
jgi:hypothetical protein